MNIAWIGNYKGSEWEAHTGYHQALALRTLGHTVDFYDWRELSGVKTGYDFYFNTDSSDYYQWREDLQPLVFWCGDIQIDTGFNGWRIERAMQSKVVLTPNIMSGRKLFDQYGIAANVIHWGWSRHWLGEAWYSKKNIDVELIGNPTCAERKELQDMIKQNFENSICGRIYEHAVYKNAMWSSKIGVQNNSMPHDDHYPNRPLEIMASNQLLIKQRLKTDEFDNYFTEGKDFIYYDDVEDLKSKIAYYIRKPTERNAIALSGYRKVQSHEYAYKMAHLVTLVEDKLWDLKHEN